MWQSKNENGREHLTVLNGCTPVVVSQGCGTVKQRCIWPRRAETLAIAEIELKNLKMSNLMFLWHVHLILIR